MNINEIQRITATLHIPPYIQLLIKKGAGASHNKTQRVTVTIELNHDCLHNYSVPTVNGYDYVC